MNLPSSEYIILQITSSLCYNNSCCCFCCVTYQNLLVGYSETGTFYLELWRTEMLIIQDGLNNPCGEVTFLALLTVGLFLHIRR